jgi:hypothetical protein
MRMAVVLLASQALSTAGTLAVPSNGIYLSIRANPGLAQNQERAIEIREGLAPNGINRTFVLHLIIMRGRIFANELSAGVFTPDSTLSGISATDAFP